MKRSGGAIGIAVIAVAALSLLLSAILVTPCPACSYKAQKIKIIDPEPEPDIRLGEPGDCPLGRAATDLRYLGEEKTPEQDRAEEPAKKCGIFPMLLRWLFFGFGSVR